MATWVLSQCGVTPLPRLYPKPTTGISSYSNVKYNPIALFQSFKPNTTHTTLSRYGKDRNWGVKVSVPLAIDYVNEEESEITNEFDPSAPPPFTLADIRAAIPKHCWVKDPWRSMSYVLRDVVIVFGLAAVAVYFNNMVVWPLYWIAQSTMFWALFVLGHDCGHGSFSSNAKLNSVVGHFLHSSILVPYHGWRISHRTHHQNHGHVENDESWHPVSLSQHYRYQV
ncbi:hypothetical protein CTI12_AA616970 [Artemisia annua]|uniref:Uncharacterized protein n=1 Tax=Artemisia annua TaxID=35608 RepID=A0A2U1KD05_ARTAN|nr:hypothetical protein CTI12_AA616970 [Artemisia annua]